MIISVIIGATGKATESLRKNFKSIPAKHSVASLQKTAVLGTSHIIREVLQFETWSLMVGITVGSRGEVAGRKGL